MRLRNDTLLHLVCLEDVKIFIIFINFTHSFYATISMQSNILEENFFISCKCHFLTVTVCHFLPTIEPLIVLIDEAVENPYRKKPMHIA